MLIGPLSVAFFLVTSCKEKEEVCSFDLNSIVTKEVLGKGSLMVLIQAETLMNRSFGALKMDKPQRVLFAVSQSQLK
jgi:hypothetical protein